MDEKTCRAPGKGKKQKETHDFQSSSGEEPPGYAKKRRSGGEMLRVGKAKKQKVTYDSSSSQASGEPRVSGGCTKKRKSEEGMLRNTDKEEEGVGEY